MWQLGPILAFNQQEIGQKLFSRIAAFVLSPGLNGLLWLCLQKSFSAWFLNKRTMLW
jgi:hypothetical protein